MKAQNKSSTLGNYSMLLPMLGIGLFILFYILSALTYPGGSWFSPGQDGFSFWHNYLCDLLDIHAINGEINTARFYAIVALGLLCAGLFWLWIYLPRLFMTNSPNQKIIKVSGLISIFTIFFLALGDHDIIVRIAGIFGLISFISCSVELFKARYTILFLLGVICVLIFLVNYYIYESGSYITSLPVIQKITFLLFIIWFIGLDIALYRRISHQKKLPRTKTS